MSLADLLSARPRNASLPPDLAGRPTDPSYGVALPFLSGDDALGEPLKKRVVQCALSRICGMCGRPLTWDVTFVGSPAEALAGAFHLPPMHRDCADVALAEHATLPVAALGRPAGARDWVLVVTGGFELVRPSSREGDMRMTFLPNAVRERHEVSAGR